MRQKRNDYCRVQVLLHETRVRLFGFFSFPQSSKAAYALLEHFQEILLNHWTILDHVLQKLVVSCDIQKKAFENDKNPGVLRVQKAREELELMSSDELIVLCQKKGVPIDPGRFQEMVERFWGILGQHPGTFQIHGLKKGEALNIFLGGKVFGT